MQNLFMTDLQFFADESAPAAAETASGAETADAGQNDVTDAAAAPQEAPSPARKSWEEVRADYKAEFDAEVQAIVMDVGLPDGDGVSLCREWRAITVIPFFRLRIPYPWRNILHREPLKVSVPRLQCEL